jgi:hypothetical protein
LELETMGREATGTSIKKIVSANSSLVVTVGDEHLLS